MFYDYDYDLYANTHILMIVCGILIICKEYIHVCTLVWMGYRGCFSDGDAMGLPLKSDGFQKNS